jgi:hypothetical protein
MVPEPQASTSPTTKQQEVGVRGVFYCGVEGATVSSRPQFSPRPQSLPQLKFNFSKNVVKTEISLQIQASTETGQFSLLYLYL